MKSWSKHLIIPLIFLLVSVQIKAEGEGESSGETPEVTHAHEQGFWVGYYTKFRLKEKLFYYGEYHMRRRGFVDEINKIYLRFGATYLLNKQVELTAGIATPINFSEQPFDAEKYDRAVLEFRFWEQALFVLPVLRSKTYHQIRLEQRWKRKNKKDSQYKLSYRWRYKLTLYVPLNHHHLQPRTLFYSFYDEIFIQTGEGVTYNIFEDNRMFNGLGYIVNNNLQVQAGYLWNFHHNGGPYDFESSHILRMAIYHTIDFYGKKQARLRQMQNR